MGPDNRESVGMRRPFGADPQSTDSLLSDNPRRENIMTRSRRWVFAVGTAALVGIFAGVAITSGQQAPSWPATRCAVVDVVQIFNRCQQTKDVNDLLQQRGAELKALREQKQQQLEKKRQELQAFDPDSPDYLKRYQELLNLQIELRTWEQFMNAQVDTENRVWLKKTYRDIIDAIQQVAAERGIDIVMYVDVPEIQGDTVAALGEQIRRRKVIWAAKHVDITETVLQRVDSDYERRGGKASINLSF